MSKCNDRAIMHICNVYKIQRGKYVNRRIQQGNNVNL